tara:strand:- start:43840 stop:44034 length:195 start_codon:yes stop_codon:yes gene_type:complete
MYNFFNKYTELDNEDIDSLTFELTSFGVKNDLFESIRNSTNLRLTLRGENLKKSEKGFLNFQKK